MNNFFNWCSWHFELLLSLHDSMSLKLYRKKPKWKVYFAKLSNGIAHLHKIKGMPAEFMGNVIPIAFDTNTFLSSSNESSSPLKGHDISFNKFLSNDTIDFTFLPGLIGSNEISFPSILAVLSQALWSNLKSFLRREDQLLSFNIWYRVVRLKF